MKHANSEASKKRKEDFWVVCTRGCYLPRLLLFLWRERVCRYPTTLLKMENACTRKYVLGVGAWEAITICPELLLFFFLTRNFFNLSLARSGVYQFFINNEPSIANFEKKTGACFDHTLGKTKQCEGIKAGLKFKPTKQKEKARKGGASLWFKRLKRRVRKAV